MRALVFLLLMLGPGAVHARAPGPPSPDPRKLETYLERARFSYRGGDLDAAIATLQSALKADPRFAGAHHLLAGLYLQQRRYVLALRHYRAETQLQPRAIPGYFGVAEACYRQRNYPPAVAALQMVLRLDPRNVTAHAKLGVIAATRGYSDPAIAQFRQALVLDPNSDVAHYYLGDLLRKQSRTKEALPHLQRAVALNPNVSLYDLSLGELYLQQPSPDSAEKALAAFQRVVALNPRLAGGYYGMGLVYQRRQQWKEAAHQLCNALALNPDYGPAHYALANVLRKLGRNAEARQHLAAFRRFRAEHVVKPGEAPTQ